LLKELSEKKQEKLDLYEIEILKEFYKKIQDEVAFIKNKASLEIAKEAMHSKMELIAKRDEMAKEVFEKLREKINAFLISEEYNVYLSRKLLLALNNIKEHCSVYVRKADIECAKAVVKSITVDVDVNEDETVSMGGFIIIKSEGLVKIDETIESKLSAQFENFNEISELVIS
jgi:hypothetical protein